MLLFEPVLSFPEDPNSPRSIKGRGKIKKNIKRQKICFFLSTIILPVSQKLPRIETKTNTNSMLRPEGISFQKIPTCFLEFLATNTKTERRNRDKQKDKRQNSSRPFQKIPIHLLENGFLLVAPFAAMLVTLLGGITASLCTKSTFTSRHLIYYQVYQHHVCSNDLYSFHYCINVKLRYWLRPAWPSLHLRCRVLQFPFSIFLSLLMSNNLQLSQSCYGAGTPALPHKTHHSSVTFEWCKHKIQLRLWLFWPIWMWTQMFPTHFKFSKLFLFTSFS